MLMGPLGAFGGGALAAGAFAATGAAASPAAFAGPPLGPAAGAALRLAILFSSPSIRESSVCICF
ncbi:MAG TPA: hypothetical protein ENG31_04145 [Candidatus Thorarchaeota archaeon]|nr:hypothetical protein [Candidatus Thorarchaeota archaeon]